MLTGLQLQNIVLIDQLELEFASGFTVLTGETGAGKSILLDALAQNFVPSAEDAERMRNDSTEGILVGVEV